jgi:hypothetical protein
MKECDIRRDWHVPNRIARVYGADTSGTITYEFNSLGYRGEEYNPSAKFKICVIGESYAFGTGLPLEQIFGYKLKEHIATSLQFDVADVNLINLSVGGVSADYCVRTLYRQLSDCDVDLVVCNLPPPDRVEYTDGTTFQSYGVAVDLNNITRAPAHVLGYFEYYNRYVGWTNLIKKALLAQAFLKERKIDYVLASQKTRLFQMKTSGYLEHYLNQLDTRSLLLHSYFVCRADCAIDGHAGPRCHAAFAVELLSFFGRMQLERGNKLLGSKIETYASHLRGVDEDWKYCTELIARRAKNVSGRNAR